MGGGFHTLRIRDVNPDTDEAMIVSFDVPESLSAAYRFEPGQHLILRGQVNGSDLRRSYSICNGEHDGQLRIAVRKVSGGVFSNWIHGSLRPGDPIQVMPPQGRFGLMAGVGAESGRHYLGIAGGSGITPILSIMKSVLARDPSNRFTLIYGNRSQKSTMFKEELEDLKNTYITGLALHYLFSREHTDTPLNSGRMTDEKLSEFLTTVIDPSDIDEVFVCGPNDVNDQAEIALRAAGILDAHIHIERFGVPSAAGAAASGAQAGDFDGARLVIIRDGLRRELEFHKDDGSILEAAAKGGLEVPFSCKSGVCCTCRAKLIEGEVRMERNFALDKKELAAGYILSCQAHPLTDTVVVSFDER
ncbi:MAG TPA: 1,2-phenylacetyl-CoA epoxidase subunit PaaE [Burkholderiaceae bacterium]